MSAFKKLQEAYKKACGKEMKEEGLKDACWKGYEAIGTKKKNGREVPNCVPVKEESEEQKKEREALDLKLARAKNGQRAAKALGEEDKKDDPPFTPDAPKKNPSAKAGKYGLGHSVAKHLARQAMKKLAKEEDTNENFASDAQRKAVWASKNEKGVKEEVEQIDEISKDTLNSYTKKAFRSMVKHDNASGTAARASWVANDKGNKDKADSENKKSEYHDNKAAKRVSGINLANKKLAKEEVEELDEISKDTLNSYVHKAFQQGNDLHYDLAHSRGNKATDAERQAIKDKISKRNTGVIKAAKKLREEETVLSFDDFMKEQKACKKEELHPNQKKLDKNKNGKLDAHDFKLLRKEEAEELDEVTSPMQKLKDAHERHMQKALAANKAGDDEATKVHQVYMQKITDKMNKLKKNEEIDLAEMEELCEISKATLGSYVKKSHDQLVKHSATKAAKYTRGDKDSLNFELSTARKEGNRQKGIDTAVKKLTKEETVEEAIGTDHVNKDVKLKRAGAKGLGVMDKLKGIKHGFDAARKGESEDELKLYNKSKSTVKEETDMVTFKELLENISEAKIDDLKDKLAAQREKRLNAYDFSKEKDKKSNVTKVKGHSYGAGEEEGEDDDDTQKVSKPAKPEVKRGRGRPAGSKSGARN